MALIWNGIFDEGTDGQKGEGCRMDGRIISCRVAGAVEPGFAEAVEDLFVGDLGDWTAGGKVETQKGRHWVDMLMLCAGWAWCMGNALYGRSLASSSGSIERSPSFGSTLQSTSCSRSRRQRVARHRFVLPLPGRKI